MASIPVTNMVNGDDETKEIYLPGLQAKSGVDIVYGMPSEELVAMSDRREVAVGGCYIEIGLLMERCCTLCQHEWRIKRRKPTAQTE